MAFRLIMTESGSSVSAEIFGDIGERSRDDRRGMEALQQIMIRSAQQRFVTQGSTAGPWAPLKESTLRRRRNRESISVLILRDTGAMMQSLTPEGNEFSLARLEIHEAQIGTNRPGADAHNEGYPGGGIPQRTFLEHSPEDRADYVATYTDFLLGRGPFSE